MIMMFNGKLQGDQQGGRQGSLESSFCTSVPGPNLYVSDFFSVLAPHVKENLKN